MLKNIDGIHNRNLTVGRRTIYVAVELRIIWLIFLKHIVDSCEQYPGNNRFLMFPSLFKSEITVADFGKFLSPNRAKGTLNKQRFNVGHGPRKKWGQNAVFWQMRTDFRWQLLFLEQTRMTSIDGENSGAHHSVASATRWEASAEFVPGRGLYLHQRSSWTVWLYFAYPTLRWGEEETGTQSWLFGLNARSLRSGLRSNFLCSSPL